jgi:protein tyrosine phosphatase (PTP) superfamily phosphohydrolase (DUF442 family)
MIRRLLLTAVASGLVFGAVGCRHRCCTDAAPRPYYPNPPSGSVIGPPGSSSTIPPAGLPVTPSVSPSVGPSAGPVVPAPSPQPSGGLPPPDPLFGAPREGNFRPTPPPANGRPAPEILLPDPLPGSGSSRSQSPARPPASGILGAPVAPVAPRGQTAEPPLAKGNAAAPAAALPGFARVKDGVSSGRKPTLDGFDTLKRAGYKTVLYLHPAGADVAATRDVAQNKGLSFVAIEVTPERLAEALDQFNTVVGDRRARPVYVADDTGVRAGALWYLHFRTVELQHDDAARIKARALGLNEQGPEATEFLLAVQRYLESR